MRLHFFALLITSISFITFSGCATHKVEEKPPVVAPVVVEEPAPVVEPPVEIEPPVVEKKVVIVKPAKKKPEAKKKVTKNKTSKQKLQKNSEDEQEDEEEKNDINATQIENLKQKINENKTREAREILNENPKAIELVGNSKNKLLYIGPSGWRVIDIIEVLRNKKLTEKEVVSHIKEAKIPYKVYTYEEIQVLLKHKLSYKVINTMMNVSR